MPFIEDLPLWVTVMHLQCIFRRRGFTAYDLSNMISMYFHNPLERMRRQLLHAAESFFSAHNTSCTPYKSATMLNIRTMVPAYMGIVRHCGALCIYNPVHHPYEAPFYRIEVKLQRNGRLRFLVMESRSYNRDPSIDWESGAYPFT